MRARTVFLTLAAASTAAILGCSAHDLTSPEKHEREKADLLGLPILKPTLIVCPSTQSFTETALITPLGGAISVGGVSISIPAGALLSDALVTVTVPASQYVETEISVAGSQHFVFELPVTVTMSYARCASSIVNLLQLSAWHIDTETKQLLEKMPSVDDKLLRTVTFTTGHLSSYAISGYAVAN